MLLIIGLSLVLAFLPQAYRSSNVSIKNEYVMDLHHMFVEEAMAVLRRQLRTLQTLDAPEGLTLKVAFLEFGITGSRAHTLFVFIYMKPPGAHPQVITGRGNHSVNGVPLIKSSVVGYLTQQGMRHHVDPTNEGVVVVLLGGRK